MSSNFLVSSNSDRVVAAADSTSGQFPEGQVSGVEGELLLPGQ